VSVPTFRPEPYRVVYSERVREELRSLLARARTLGFGEEATTTVREIDRRLKIYPQFGEPLRGLQTPGHTVWVAALWSLYIEYVVDEANRAVYVVEPLKVIPHSDLDQ
jgi:hypothetical protein